jgi:hypothetical protein
MNLDDLQLPEQKQMLDLIAELKASVEKGEIVSIIAVAECSDGSMWGSATACQNVFAVCGYLQYWIARRLGFIAREGR